MSNHTAGDWRPFFRYVLCNGRFLATAHCVGDTGHGAGFKPGQEPLQDANEAEANAVLMAAGPAMLAALLKIARINSHEDYTFDQRETLIEETARAAIALTEPPKE